MTRKQSLLLALAAVASILFYAGHFIVAEWNQAIVTQFGKIVRDPITQAGIHFKLPFIQDVRYFDRRILTWDGAPSLITTKDKKYIEVDTSARWRITDPVKFLQTVQTEDRARNRIGSILEGKTKNVISGHKLVETVRNTNEILETAPKLQGTDIDDEPISGEIEKIEVGREKLSQQIFDDATPEIATLGIELIDVLIIRIAYEKSVEDKVFDRMISERNKVAEKIRSIGQGEKAKITGKLNKDLKEIESEAYKLSQTIKGKAEAQAIAIYAQAMRSDPGFYKFTRTLESYRKTLPEKAKLLVSSESKFFELLTKGQ